MTGWDMLDSPREALVWAVWLLVSDSISLNLPEVAAGSVQSKPLLTHSCSLESLNIRTCPAGVLSISLGFGLLPGLWSLFAGLLLCLWEFPWIFCCIPKYEDHLKLINEKLYFQRDEVKSLICFLLSVICFLKVSLPIISGVALDITGVLFIFAAINKKQDNQDGFQRLDSESGPGGKSTTTTASTQPPAAVVNAAQAAKTLLGGANRFGTF